jgi:hypothetical protein
MAAGRPLRRKAATKPGCLNERNDGPLLAAGRLFSGLFDGDLSANAAAEAWREPQSYRIHLIVKEERLFLQPRERGLDSAGWALR